jgi:exopolysaccharide biosynthesis polyprenyl glycosylphosphotransferase
MLTNNKKEAFLLFLGDLVIFSLSLWFSLFLRDNIIPSLGVYLSHVIAFGFVFITWTLVFYIAGLYDKYTTILREKLPATILNAQLVNSAIAVLFFYIFPYFGIAPKIILFVVIVISFVLIYLWRVYVQIIFGSRHKEPSIIIGSGEELKTLEKEINNNKRLGLRFVSSIDLDKDNGLDFIKEITEKIYSENVSVIVVDLKDNRIEPILPHLYNLMFSGVRFLDIDEIYENIFERVPLSLIKYSWFLENISLAPKAVYGFLKRFSDIMVAIILGIIFIIILPFIALAIFIEDGKPVFYSHERIGKNGKRIKISKFRSMSTLEKEKITKVGSFLRKTRLDELPQFWAVIKGDLSLIGPRPEKPDLVDLYDKEIPYYNIRHLIKPGLSGWAQICQENPPKFEVNFADTKIKLSYDLYYLKNKSAMLDLKIALKTIKALILRVGR